MKKDVADHYFVDNSEEKTRGTGQRVRDMPVDDRPYEKCFKYGPGVLSDRELLAIILKSGAEGACSLKVAQEVLTMPDGSLNFLALHHKTAESLMKIRGIGRVKAVTLKCIAEISERIAKASFGKKVNFSLACEVAGYYGEEMRHLNYEQTRLVCLNGSCRLVGECILSKGIVNQALISTRDIFLKALEYQAVYIILLHNHPGGDARPSRCDLDVTQKVAQAGELMDIKLLDHIIIGDASYVSLKESGYL